MSDRAPGFRGRSIQSVQSELFLRDLPRSGGRFRYPISGLKADPGTLVLFQYRAHIIASALFLRDEKFDNPLPAHAGDLHFAPQSIRTFTPLDLHAMRKVWPWFRAFGHAKQKLNPTLHPAFNRLLKHVKTAPKTPKQ
jgi:hypothetical protein